MTVKAQPSISILCHCLTRLLGQHLSSLSSSDAIESVRTEVIRLGRYLHGFERRATCVAGEALGMEALG